MPVTNYIYDGNQYLAESDESNTINRLYTNQPDAYTHLISQEETSSGDTSIYHYDAIGSTREVTDDAETVTDELSYDAWGYRLARIGTSDIPFQYVGQSGYYRDEPLLEYYVMLRTYSPQAIRWLSADPLYAYLTEGKYQYASNAPSIYIDPSGLQTAGDYEEAWDNMCPRRPDWYWGEHPEKYFPPKPLPPWERDNSVQWPPDSNLYPKPHSRIDDILEVFERECASFKANISASIQSLSGTSLLPGAVDRALRRRLDRNIRPYIFPGGVYRSTKCGLSEKCCHIATVKSHIEATVGFSVTVRFTLSAIIGKRTFSIPVSGTVLLSVDSQVDIAFCVPKNCPCPATPCTLNVTPPHIDLSNILFDLGDINLGTFGL